MWIRCWRVRRRTRSSATGRAFPRNSWPFNTRPKTPSTTKTDARAQSRRSAACMAVFSDGQGAKRRPVLVVHDFGDDDLLVVPITSQRACVVTDLILLDWKSAGLKLP